MRPWWSTRATPPAALRSTRALSARHDLVQKLMALGDGFAPQLVHLVHQLFEPGWIVARLQHLLGNVFIGLVPAQPQDERFSPTQLQIADALDPRRGPRCAFAGM